MQRFNIRKTVKARRSTTFFLSFPCCTKPMFVLRQWSLTAERRLSYWSACVSSLVFSLSTSLRRKKKHFGQSSLRSSWLHFIMALCFWHKKIKNKPTLTVFLCAVHLWSVLYRNVLGHKHFGEPSMNSNPKLDISMKVHQIHENKNRETRMCKGLSEVWSMFLWLTVWFTV